MVGGRAKRSRSTREDSSSNPGRGSFLATSGATYVVAALYPILAEPEKTTGGAKAAFLASDQKYERIQRGRINSKEFKKTKHEAIVAPFPHLLHTRTEHISGLKQKASTKQLSGGTSKIKEH